MANTRIPVLGHADGICHLYVHASANVDKAIPVVIDAKAQYPAACNAVETLLVDSAIANAFLPRFKPAAQNAGITLKGCYRTQTIIPGIATATDDDWSTEYGEPILSVRIVDSLDQAIEHIHRYGSHHTDGILATDPHTIETFLNRVDSASVFSNASTRFADGFRFGLGAESGISTARTHARGPVGLEGLVIYKYKLRGNHHQVADYVGADARPFRHQRMPHPGV
jgi:glutamate-5-semialdehyde dehydrogenase